MYNNYQVQRRYSYAGYERSWVQYPAPSTNQLNNNNKQIKSKKSMENIFSRGVENALIEDDIAWEKLKNNKGLW